MKDKNELVGIDQELVWLIQTINEEYEREDEDEREQKKQLWTKLDKYFQGLQRIYYDYGAKDWRNVNDKSVTSRHYDKIINIYRAHGESIIAALSIRPPTALFYPADANVEADITTAQVCTKIKEIIERQNDAQLLMIKALQILFNQGTIAAYIYNKKSHKYGTYSTVQYGKNSVMHTVLLNCTNCGSNLQEIGYSEEPKKIPEEPLECPVCHHYGIPGQENYAEEIPTIIGSKLEAKSKTCIELYSPLYVYMPFYAKTLEQAPYLRLCFEQHYSSLKSIYPKLKKRGFNKSVEEGDARDRGVQVEVNKSNLCTVDCWWVRPWGYEIIDDQDDKIKKLKELYPDGYYAICIDDELVEIHNESLDAHWEVSRSPLSNYIHGEPLGKSLAPIQELANEVVDLQIETLEHAIPETWAKSDVVDFKSYGKSRAAPGMMYPAKMDPSETLSSAFHTLKPATLSQETQVFLEKLQGMGQFVSGSFPSIYGGPSTSGSKTAKEYSESRAMALQRLSIPWQNLKFFWAALMSKAVPLYIHAMKESGQDEKVVEKTELGFVNTWIRTSDIEGTVGRVEADAQEDMPQTPTQLKGVLVELFSLGNEIINEALLHPENTPFLTKALGNPDLYIPNSDDRNKQYAEFAQILGGEMVEVNPTIDNHEIEAETCRAFLVSATGLMLKKHNPEGYKAIEDHLLMHKEAMQTMNPTAGMPPGMEGMSSEGMPQENPNAAQQPPMEPIPLPR